MSADRASRARQWFEAACDLPEAEWAGFLRGCEDASLRAEVLDLLRRDRVPGLPLDDPLLPPAQRDALLALAGDAPMPARIAGYDIVRVLGRGSMGTVYEATPQGGGASVALKVLRLGLPSRAVLHRFRREAEILARLDHPCIARILASGTTDTGDGSLPFIAMELVSGRPLDACVDEERLDVRARLQLLVRIGEAVEHAHRRGVVHRDLKPSNILVDAQGRPRLVDFGVARAAWPAGASASLHTGAGQLVGTMQYMSPEQTLGDPSAVDARSDVYALGAIAYALLAGRPPYNVGSCSFDEALRRIRHEDPPRLGPDLGELGGAAEPVVARALEKSRDDRYPSAQAFVDDLRAVLDGRPSAARAPGALQLARRFARRNPGAFRAAAAIAALLLLGIAGTSWGWLEARARQRDVAALLDRQREQTRAADAARVEAEAARADAETARAESERARADAERSQAATQAAWRQSEAVVAFLQDVFGAVRPDELGSLVLLADVLLPAASRVDEDFADQPELAARLHLVLASAFHSVALHDRALQHLDAAERLAGPTAAGDAAVRQDPRFVRAAVLIDQGRFDAAAELLEAVCAQLPAAAIERRAESTRSLARALSLGGDAAAAEARLTGLLDTDGHVAGASAALDEGVRLDLAHLATLRGETAAAEATVRAVLQSRTERLGAEHYDTLEASERLAELLRMTGRTDEAEELYVRRAQVLADLLGPEHPHTLYARGRLALLLTEVGRSAEALPELEQLLASSRRALGDDHPRTASLMCTLSTAAMHTGRPDAAELVDEALAAGRAALPDGHPGLVTMLSNAGAIRLMDGRLEEGAELLYEALDICERTDGARALDLVLVQTNLAGALLTLGRPDEARPLVEDALARSRTLQGDRHLQTLTLIAYLAGLCAQTGEVPRARALLEEVLAAGLPPTTPLLLSAQGNLGVLLLDLGETAEGEALLRATLPRVEQVFGADHALAAQCRAALATLPAAGPPSGGG